MSQRCETATIETLLEHAEWVRHLATHLVHGDRDDAVQDSWLAALRSPPDADRPPRPWLARVLQNAARRRFRDDASRRALEEKGAALPDEVPTPEQIVERAETHRLLVDSVLALDEPFRRVVLLRYFEGLSSAEIARAMEVPAGTVRWRLKEGIDRLRAALDARHGGDRQAWSLLIAPIAFAPSGRLGPIGVVAMATKMKMAVVGGVTLLAGVLALASPRCGESADRSLAMSGGHGDAARPSQLQAERARWRREDSIAPVREGSPGAVPTLRSGSTAVQAAAATSEAALGSLPAGSEPVVPQIGQVESSDGGVLYPVDKEGIRTAVKAAIPEVRDCYEEWLKVQPGLGGRVKATFTIDTDDGVEGKVEGVSLGDAGIGHFAMEGCILSAFQGLRFEAPMNGPIKVTYPLALVPGSDGGQ